MSSIEHHKGTAKLLPKPANMTSKEHAAIIMDKYGLNKAQIEEYGHDNALDFITSEYSTSFYYNESTDKLYRLKDEDLGEDFDVYHAVATAEDTIEYEVVFYNGGTDLSVALDRAFLEIK